MKPSPALVVALIALFVSIGGVGYAASQIGTNDIKNGAVTKKKLHKKAVATRKIKGQAVKTGKIADLAVTTGKLADQAVTTDKIADQAVTTDKLALQSVTADRIAESAVTTDKLDFLSVTSGKLANDSVAASKLAGTADTLETRIVPAQGATNVTVACSAGGQALAGGYFTPADGAVQVTRMRRESDTQWSFTFRNNTNAARDVDARVTCLIP